MLKRLDVQILLLLSLILAVMISAFGWRIGSRQEAIYVRSMGENVRVISQSHADSAAHFLVIGEYAGLEDHMLEAARMPNVLSLQVIETDGTILCTVEKRGAEIVPTLSYRQKHGEIPAASKSFIRLDGGQLVSWTPIVAGKPLGWLKATFSLSASEEMRADLWRNSLSMGSLAILFGIMLMALVLKRPLRAIRELAAFAHDLNRHKGKQLTIPHGAAEIEQLASALNYASSDLFSAEQQLMAEQERLAVTIRSIGDGVLACDRDGRVMLMNRVAEELTGWCMAEAIGHSFTEVFVVVDEVTGAPLDVFLQRVIETGSVIELVEQAVLVSRDGNRHNIADSGAPIINALGEIMGVVIVFRDETARLKDEGARLALEEQLRQSQKMEAIGLLAGGIAHDFNNILTAIIGYTAMVTDTLDPNSQEREMAQRVLKAADRATSLTAGLLAFSRKQKMELKLCNLNAILLEQEKMLQRIIGEDIQLQTDLVATPLMINADAIQIGQVILNLATNARDAMVAGGMLSIATQMVNLDASSRDHEGQLPGHGRYALICISDSGVGMDEATVAKIFEPFFTTKTVGKGTGLGLAIVHGIVQQHGGFIRVYSNPGIGTTFKIYLPLLEGEEIAAAADTIPMVRGGTESILLVEDEEEVRQVLHLMLTGGGYKVMQAADGVAALEVMEREGTSIQLVVSDVIMPRMTGKELHDNLVERFPQVRMLFISGYTADVIQFRGMLEHDVNLLMKPFNATTLLARVRAVLDGER